MPNLFNNVRSLPPTIEFRSLLNILPGGNKKIIMVGSQFPTDILKLLDQLTGTIDTVILINGDVWRYFDAREEIFNHPNLQHKNVFLQTLGYTNTKFNDRCWEISYPLFYWQGEKSTVEFVAKPSGLKYGFSCLNNSNNMHRTILGYQLYKNNLLSDIIFSQNIFDNGYAITRVSQDAKILNLNDFEEYRNLLPIRAQMENIPEGQEFRGDHNNAIPTHPAYTTAYCNIVTESECEEYPYSRNINLPISTEKSYKPLRAGQVPIMLAARGHIAYFKSLGFEMMEDLMPEGYDQMNVLQKIAAIVAIVSKGNEFIEDFYFSHLKEIRHNYELINSSKVEELILQNIKEKL
jgi:hypothetical protein